MLLIKAEDVSVEINGNILFEHASIEVHDGDRIALIGKNGVGKTTFIKSLIGKYAISKGVIKNQTQIDQWGWMDQDTEHTENITAREYVEQENQKLFSLKGQLKRAEMLLDSTPDNSDLVSNYTNDLQKYMDLDGYEWESAVEKQLSQVGLSEQTWSLPFAKLSGGQKTRAKLARVMINKPRFLVLDEPTNHLDAESMEWLANWIIQFKGAVLFISHEREFIDKVAKVTYELTEKGAKKYIGGYSFYSEQKEHEQKTLEAQYQKQEIERKKLVETISHYRQWFDKAHQSASERDPFAKKKANKNMTRLQAKEKALERLEKNKVEKSKEASKLNVQLEADGFSSRTMITLQDVDFSYSDKTRLLSNLSLTVKRGDRIAVVGKNGTGKTTFLKLLTGHLSPTSGGILTHPQLKIGYFMQELEGLHQEDTIIEQILTLPNMTQTEARTILACFLFRKEDVFKKVKDLSMGEKCRVAFVKLYFSNANLLIFDEPTNYLDIETRERIEDALSLYPGAIILVSHDTFLLRKVANRVITLDNGEFTDYPGTYEEWLGSEKTSSHTQEIKNEQSRLQLQLANLLADDVPEDEAYLLKLKNLKAKIDLLQEAQIDSNRQD